MFNCLLEFEVDGGQNQILHLAEVSSLQGVGYAGNMWKPFTHLWCRWQWEGCPGPGPNSMPSGSVKLYAPPVHTHTHTHTHTHACIHTHMHTHHTHKSEVNKVCKRFTATNLSKISRIKKINNKKINLTEAAFADIIAVLNTSKNSTSLPAPGSFHFLSSTTTLAWIMSQYINTSKNTSK